MASIESRLAIIEAKDEIRELTARYCHAVVDGDADAIVELFCEDGVFRSHTLAPKGREELREFYAAGVGGKSHKPFVQNHVIEIEDETHATGRCSVEIRVLQDGEAYTQAGHYFDKYRKDDDRWRFVERHYIRYHNVPWREGWKK
ncbi:MAG: nuclear transport factor 2 family protein [Pseudomonadales bacterium]